MIMHIISRTFIQLKKGLQSFWNQNDHIYPPPALKNRLVYIAFTRDEQVNHLLLKIEVLQCCNNYPRIQKKTNHKFWESWFQRTTMFSQMAMNLMKFPHGDQNGPILHKTHVPEFSISLLSANKSSLEINYLLKMHGLHGLLNECLDDL